MNTPAPSTQDKTQTAKTDAKADAKTKSKPASKTPSVTVFESREKEASMFKVMDIRPIRNFSTGRLEWQVPADKVALFEQHHFVMNGRITRKS